ncbi:hypothetical protein Bca101_070615 [Brassica carinata]
MISPETIAGFRDTLQVLKIDRSEPSELHISEDPVVYSPQEIKSLLLQRIAEEGYRSTGGLAIVAKVYGIKNVLSSGEEAVPYDNIFLWNAYLTQPIRSRCNQQHYLGILSRRSRHFAGTRYLKRGANDVETEQLVFDEEAGSKNDLSGADARINSTLLRYDPTYESTKMHFEDLVRRYGNPIIVLNLIKDFTSVASLRSLRTKLAILVRELSLRDLRAYSVELTRGESSNDILTALANREKEMKLSQQKIDDGTDSSAPLYQSGVLRTNCIDCLDRTNVVGRKLHAMGLSDTSKIDPNSSIAAAALMDMYQSMGDALAQQYGGSAAHNTVFPERQGKWKATTQSREFLKSIQRYYSNTYTDGEKQDAINLFLGYIQPQDGKPALWELDSDYYLHVLGIGDDIFPGSGVLSIPKPMSGIGVNLAPVPAFREDFSRKKPTSFDKLIEQTCSSIKNTRLCSETDQRPGGSTGSTGVAPDAA